MKGKRIYFDYAATTPVGPEVLKTMKPYFKEKYGNPGSLHSFGQEATAAVDKARETIAKAISAPPAGGFREIIFTGSATEANNLALRGVIKAYKTNKSNWSNKSYRIIVSAIEHESVLETARDLEKEGVEIIYLPVDKNGFVDLKKLKKSLNDRTILVSVMYANNEIGTIQPISKIGELISEFRKQKSEFPLFHTDAVQAFQYLDCDMNKLGVDLMTFSAHKIYGPKGVGALFIRPISLIGPISPILTGGGQEFGLRSGTENIPAIVGFAKAVEIVLKNRNKELKRMTELRNYFWQELKKIYPKVEVNGYHLNGRPAQAVLPKNSLPNILNVYFPGLKAEDLLIKFDMAGIAVSAGSACRARSLEPSYVLRAMSFPENRISQSLRFSFGRFTTLQEIKDAIKRMEKLL